MSLFVGFGRQRSKEEAAGEDGPDAAEPTEAATAEEIEESPAEKPRRNWRDWRYIRYQVATALAFGLVMFALLSPNRIDRVSLGSFVRIPLEGLLGVVLIVFLQPRARKAVAIVAGLLLGLVTITKIVDMGFGATLARNWDPVLDWTFVGNGIEFLTETAGRAGAIGAVIGVVALIVGVMALMTLSVLRLSRVAVRHETATMRTAAGLGVAWVACSMLGAQLAPNVPVASSMTATFAYKRAMKVNSGLHDKEKFEREARVDAYANTPGSQLLTALRGKDVLLAFVESYGRTAVEGEKFAPQVDAVLSNGTSRLKEAGFGSRSGWLKSPTAGGGSWLAHSTLLSGLWINNQQRYQNMVNSDRLTLNKAFQRASWRTIGLMPGVRRAWPEGKFFGFDKIYTSTDLGYRGPNFGWGPMPDQYVLTALQRLERSREDHAPIMVEMPLVSSHAPWAPIPSLIGWDQVGDGSVYWPQARSGEPATAVWKNPEKVRTQYRKSIEYTLSVLIQYMERYGDDDTVLVFLGDHQPVPLVVGSDAPREVPITIVAKDPKVLDRISSWGWTDGLKPAKQAPVWPMNTFRDKFLYAYGSTPK